MAVGDEDLVESHSVGPLITHGLNAGGCDPILIEGHEYEDHAHVFVGRGDEGGSESHGRGIGAGIGFRVTHRSLPICGPPLAANASLRMYSYIPSPSDPP